MQGFDSWEKRSKGSEPFDHSSFWLGDIFQTAAQVGGIQGKHSGLTELRSEKLKLRKVEAPDDTWGQNIGEWGTVERSSPRNLYMGSTWAFSWLLNFPFMWWGFMRPGSEQSLGSCNRKNGQGWEMFKSRKRIKRWFNALVTFSRNPGNVRS